MPKRSLLRRSILRNTFFLLATLSFLALRLTPRNQRQPTATHAPRPAGLPSATAALPDPRLTPGAVNPAVTQANIANTICVVGYTKTVRPPFRVSNQLKHQIMNLYHSQGSIHDYELDHLIPLELGGCPTCIANLWPQPWTTPGANEKDEVESYLRDRVCHRLMPLSEAQHLIATKWYSIYLAINR